jgi:hypothetical protein
VMVVSSTNAFLGNCLSIFPVIRSELGAISSSYSPFLPDTLAQWKELLPALRSVPSSIGHSCKEKDTTGLVCGLYTLEDCRL